LWDEYTVAFLTRKANHTHLTKWVLAETQKFWKGLAVESDHRTPNCPPSAEKLWLGLESILLLLGGFSKYTWAHSPLLALYHWPSWATHRADLGCIHPGPSSWWTCTARHGMVSFRAGPGCRRPWPQVNMSVSCLQGTGLHLSLVLGPRSQLLSLMDIASTAIWPAVLGP
jgi:hypothetical protein